MRDFLEPQSLQPLGKPFEGLSGFRSHSQAADQVSADPMPWATGKDTSPSTQGLCSASSKPRSKGSTRAPTDHTLLKGQHRFLLEIRTAEDVQLEG